MNAASAQITNFYDLPNSVAAGMTDSKVPDNQAGYEKGITGMRYSISNTAEYGDMTRGPRIVNDDTRAKMKKILGEIQSGEFAKEWLLENQIGRPRFNALARRGSEQQVEQVGREIRAMMSWIDTVTSSRPL